MQAIFKILVEMIVELPKGVSYNSANEALREKVISLIKNNIRDELELAEEDGQVLDVYLSDDDSSTEELALKKVTSSNIDSLGYLESAQLLEVKFKGGGGRYRYHNVPPSVYGMLSNSPSIGQAFHRMVKDRYVFEQVKEVSG